MAAGGRHRLHSAARRVLHADRSLPRLTQAGRGLLILCVVLV